MNTYWISCIGIALIWAVISVMMDDKETSRAATIISQVFVAASFIILAIEHYAENFKP